MRSRILMENAAPSGSVNREYQSGEMSDAKHEPPR